MRHDRAALKNLHSPWQEAKTSASRLLDLKNTSRGAFDRKQLQLVLAERTPEEIIGPEDSSVGTAEQLGIKEDFLDIRIEIKRKDGGPSRTRKTAVGRRDESSRAADDVSGESDSSIDGIDVRQTLKESTYHESRADFGQQHGVVIQAKPKPAKQVKPEKPEKVEKTQKNEKPEKAEKLEKLERPEKQDKAVESPRGRFKELAREAAAASALPKNT